MNIQLHKYNPEFQSKKIPRYIYHMTSKANYDAILRDGFIKMSDEKLMADEGIYAFDLMNFIKHWTRNKDWGNEDLQSVILRHIVKWFPSTFPAKSELVILRIPTAGLDADKLFVRSMNRLFKFKDSEQRFNSISPALQQHLSGVTPACETPLYKMRKEAIEFIYKDDIPVENFQRIGEIINIPSLRKDMNFSKHPVKYIMQMLLTGTPEVKSVDFLK